MARPREASQQPLLQKDGQYQKAVVGVPAGVSNAPAGHPLAGVASIRA